MWINLLKLFFIVHERSERNELSKVKGINKAVSFLPICICNWPAWWLVATVNSLRVAILGWIYTEWKNILNEPYHLTRTILNRLILLFYSFTIILTIENEYDTCDFLFKHLLIGMHVIENKGENKSWTQKICIWMAGRASLYVSAGWKRSSMFLHTMSNTMSASTKYRVASNC